MYRCIDNVYRSWGGYRFSDRYEIVGELGSGGFGAVYKVRRKGTDKVCAAKKLDKDRVDATSLRNEVQCLMRLDHPHIIKLIRCYDEAGELVVLFEICTGPDLFDAIVERLRAGEGRISDQDTALWLRHMLKALSCVHGKYMGHFDIKPENFMFATKDTTAGCNLKMIDMGMSGRYDSSSRELKGTRRYMAPEIFRGIYGPEADVWSCGVVLFLMLTGHEFLQNTDDLTDEELQAQVSDRSWVRQRLRWAEQRGVSALAMDLLQRMLYVDRHMRILLKDAMEHSFVTGSYTVAAHSPEVYSEALIVLETLEEQLRRFAARPMLTRAALMLTARLVSNDVNAMAPQRLAFRMLDRAGFGELSVDALEASYRRLGIPTSDDLDQLFKVVDLEGDGYISFTEFLASTMPSSIRHSEFEFLEAFDILDRNKDGFIDATDLIRVLGFTAADDRQLCHDAMEEVTAAPHRLSRQEFMQLFDGGAVE